MGVKTVMKKLKLRQLNKDDVTVTLRRLMNQI
jgi:hypothetical protein